MKMYLTSKKNKSVYYYTENSVVYGWAIHFHEATMFSIEKEALLALDTAKRVFPEYTDQRIIYLDKSKVYISGDGKDLTDAYDRAMKGL